MNTPQVLVPGLWFFPDKKPEAMYIANTNGDTAQLRRKIIKDGKEYHDSAHILFSYLRGIPLEYDILVDNMGFLPAQNEARKGYVYREIRSAIKVLQGDDYVQVKPATNLYIDIDESGKRFTNFLECGENKIYLPEVSYVHEVQLLIYTLTYSFPYIVLNKTQIQNEQTEQSES